MIQEPTLENNSRERSYATVHAHAEICRMIRHYSRTCLTIRIICLITGTLMLVAAGLFFTIGAMRMAFGIAFCGLLITVVTYLMHNGYYAAVLSYCRIGADLEKELYVNDSHRMLEQFIVSEKELKKHNFYNSWVNYAPFVSLIVFFLLLSLVTVGYLFPW